MSRMIKAAGLATAVFAILFGASGAQAATVVIGKIASEKSCKLYQESAGRSSVVATRHVFAESDSWRTWLVKDCVDNFATIRTSLEAALASTGKFSVKTQGSGYTLTGAISQVGGEGSPAPAVPTSSGGYSVSSSQMFVSMVINLRDPSGRVLFGGLLTKHLETGSRIQTNGLTTSSSQSGAAVYTELQHQVALAVARLVAFHIDPLKVTAVEDREISLNYGSPLLTLGTTVHVETPGGLTPVRYNVTSASPDGATAEVDGERGDWTKVGPGNIASVIESDDPANNERRIKKVDLPE